MTEDPQLAAKRISATDIDAVFTTEAEPSHEEGDHETGGNKQVKIQMKIVSANFTFFEMIIPRLFDFRPLLSCIIILLIDATKRIRCKALHNRVPFSPIIVLDDMKEKQKC